MIGVPRSKTKSDIQYLTLFSKDTELYICYNKKWKIVGMVSIFDYILQTDRQTVLKL